MAGRGHSVLFCARPDTPAVELARSDGLPVSTELALEPGFRPALFLRDRAAARRLFERWKPDVVHVYLSPEYWTSALALGGARSRPLLVRGRGIVTPIQAHPFNRWIHNQRTDLVVCACTRIAELYRKLPGFDASKVRVVPDAVDVERFRPGAAAGAARELRASLGVAPDELLLLSVARLTRVKGHAGLFEALAAVAERLGKWKLVCAGRENEIDEVRAHAERAGVIDRVVFAGVRDDVPQLLDASDLFVLASIGSEGSSRATLEAMASGMAVVATDVGSLPDLVVPGETGLLVPPRDAGALGRAVLDLASDPARRAEMGRRGRARVLARFTGTHLADAIEACYAEAAERRSR
jgi:glycosyltransferase involved in cell wall biosynthesis